MEKKTMVRPLEIKSLDENGVFEGYGSVFGNVDSYGDIVVKGAFTKALSTKTASQIKLLWQHDSTQPIGVYDAVTEHEKGLYVRGRLLIGKVQKATEAYELMKAGAISGLSIGYTVDDSSFGDNGQKYLKEINPWEISVVTFPANDLATVTGVKNASQILTIRDFEKHLRDLGFSQSKAVAIASNGFKAIETIDAQREVEDEMHAQLLQSLRNLTNTIKGCK